MSELPPPSKKIKLEDGVNVKAEEIEFENSNVHVLNSNESSTVPHVHNGLLYEEPESQSTILQSPQATGASTNNNSEINRNSSVYDDPSTSTKKTMEEVEEGTPSQSQSLWNIPVTSPPRGDRDYEASSTNDAGINDTANEKATEEHGGEETSCISDDAVCLDSSASNSFSEKRANSMQLEPEADQLEAEGTQAGDFNDDDATHFEPTHDFVQNTTVIIEKVPNSCNNILQTQQPNEANEILSCNNTNIEQLSPDVNAILQHGPNREEIFQTPTLANSSEKNAQNSSNNIPTSRIHDQTAQTGLMTVKAEDSCQAGDIAIMHNDHSTQQTLELNFQEESPDINPQNDEETKIEQRCNEGEIELSNLSKAGNVKKELQPDGDTSANEGNKSAILAEESNSHNQDVRESKEAIINSSNIKEENTSLDSTENPDPPEADVQNNTNKVLPNFERDTRGTRFSDVILNGDENVTLNKNHFTSNDSPSNQTVDEQNIEPGLVRPKNEEESANSNDLPRDHFDSLPTQSIAPNGPPLDNQEIVSHCNKGTSKEKAHPMDIDKPSEVKGQEEEVHKTNVENEKQSAHNNDISRGHSVCQTTQSAVPDELYLETNVDNGRNQTTIGHNQEAQETSLGTQLMDEDVSPENNIQMQLNGGKAGTDKTNNQKVKSEDNSTSDIQQQHCSIQATSESNSATEPPLIYTTQTLTILGHRIEIFGVTEKVTVFPPKGEKGQQNSSISFDKTSTPTFKVVYQEESSVLMDLNENNADKKAPANFINGAKTEVQRCFKRKRTIANTTSLMDDEEKVDNSASLSSRKKSTVDELPNESAIQQQGHTNNHLRTSNELDDTFDIQDEEETTSSVWANEERKTNIRTRGPPQLEATSSRQKTVQETTNVATGINYKRAETGGDMAFCCSVCNCSDERKRKSGNVSLFLTNCLSSIDIYLPFLFFSMIV